MRSEKIQGDFQFIDGEDDDDSVVQRFVHSFIHVMPSCPKRCVMTLDDVFPKYWVTW